jgi:hypothetical protein
VRYSVLPGSLRYGSHSDSTGRHMKKLVAYTEWDMGKITAHMYLKGGLYVVQAHIIEVELTEYCFETANVRHAVAWYAHVVAHVTERVEVGGL